MNENPYRTPEAALEAEGVLSGSLEDLRPVAIYQKVINVCILLYLGAIVARLFLIPDPLVLALGFGVLLVALTGMVFTVLLSLKLYGVGLGILLGVLTLIPVVGLIVLLVVNGKATKVLKQNGVQVGLLGARMSTLPEPG